MTLAIPLELHDGIIDHLHDDKTTLGRCGLVCKFWLPSSRFHLFSTVRLFSSDIDIALTVLCAPGCTIPPYVRYLEMEEGHGFEQWDALWVETALLQLPPLNAVESLSMSNVSWNGVRLETRGRLYCLMRGLKTLILDFMTFDTFDEALELISCAPSLECLSLGSIRCRIGDAQLNKSVAPPMKRIMFGDSSSTLVLIDWLRHWQPVPTIHSVAFGKIILKQIPSISAYLRTLEPVLEHLELSCADFDNSSISQVTLPQRINLARHTSLRTISFDVYVGSPGFDWIIDILSQITSRCLARVTVVILLNTPQDITSLNFPPLVSLFSDGGTFAERSTKLRLAIFGKFDRVEAKAVFTEAFRDLDSQGRLEFGGNRVGLCMQRVGSIMDPAHTIEYRQTWQIYDMLNDM